MLGHQVLWNSEHTVPGAVHVSALPLLGVGRPVHAVLRQEDGQVDQFLAGVLHADFLEPHVAHRGVVGVVNAERRAVLDVNDIAVP